MAVQFIIGASGTGKSYYLNHRIIKEAVEHPSQKYIMLVPEQFTSELQREMIALHPDHGFMNIDIIGFNRLAYRIFEEQNVKVGAVLEDFGKSMLIRRIAGKMKDDFSVYQNCVDKYGFIDEVKSLFSELFTYAVSEQDIRAVMDRLSKEDELYLKLQDIMLIYHAFTEYIEGSYIVAEQTVELMADYIKTSELVKQSVISMDGFTGFTPIQMRLIRELLLYAKEVRITVTIDRENFFRNSVREHELYYLSRQTIDRLNRLIEENGTVREETVVMERSKTGRFALAPMLSHLEQAIFRYPGRVYEAPVPESGEIEIWECQNRREEMACIAEAIRNAVRSGYRYSEIAVVTADLENLSEYAGKILDDYHIPYFMDYSRKMKNNPFMDALKLLLEMPDRNFDYESVFSFLKSGIVSELSEDMIEKLENYAVARGIRGYSGWKKAIPDAGFSGLEQVRIQFMNLIEPYYPVLKKKEAAVSEYVTVLLEFAEKMDYENRIAIQADAFEEEGKFSEAAAYRHLYEKLQELFQKLNTIMPEERMPLHEFLEIIRLGMDEISMGIIPPTQDMLVIGDINRTRLGAVKLLFFANINDGIIPSLGKSGRILSDRDRDCLESCGIEMAPTDRMNVFIEQFYLYLIMTKPSQKLVLSYSRMGNDNAAMEPSYLIDRICSIFPGLQPMQKTVTEGMGTYETDIYFLTENIRKLITEPESADLKKTALLYKFYEKESEGLVPEILRNAYLFGTRSTVLSAEARDAIRKRLLSVSVSRLERYACCAYSYFLQYGLGLRERRRYEMDARNIGDILHLALKETFYEIRKDHGNDWEHIPEEEVLAIMEQKVSYACETEKSGILSDEGRNRFVIQSLQDIGRRTIRTLRYQILQGKMKPTYFEHSFNGLSGIREAMLSVSGEEIPLAGVIDRADINIEGDNIYVNLIDYKTGNKEFKPEYFYEGLELQLVVYMNILLEIVAKDYPNRNVIPAGMYYYHVDNPYLSDESVIEESEETDPDALEEKIRSELRLRGVPNIEPHVMEMQERDILEKDSGAVIPVDFKKGELKSSTLAVNEKQFRTLCAFGKTKLEELSEKIVSGVFPKQPVKKGRNIQCEYCAYQEACGFNRMLPGQKIRTINESAGNRKEIWKKMTDTEVDQEKGGNAEDGMES